MRQATLGRLLGFSSSVLLFCEIFSGCNGTIGDADSGGNSSGPDQVHQDDPDVETAEMAVPSGARRLSRVEYDNTVRDLLDEDTRPGSVKLPEDANDPFDNDYRTQLVSTTLIESVETLAQEISARAIKRPETLAHIVPCKPAGAGDEACLSSFIETFGRRALRRPMTGEEVQRYMRFKEFAVEKQDFNAAVELVINAMLQEIEFLYRIELGEAVEGAEGVYRLDDFQIASRMSYFLWGSTPDDALLDFAQEGKLRDPKFRQEAATSMLADPRTRERVQQFHTAWLGYRVLPHSAELTDAMRQESAALIDRVIFEEHGDYLDIFRSDETFVDATLAEHYGLPAPSDPNGAWVSYGDSGRQGILSHGSVLSAFAKFTDTSPTQRGKFVRERLMCQTISPPPPNVNADQPPKGNTENACKSERYAVHKSGGCESCHNQMDPVGFGLEAYDKAGRFRETEDGRPDCPITGDGELVELGKFNGPADLSNLLIESGKLEGCVVTQAYRLAMGRRELKDDVEALTNLKERFSDNGRAFDALLLDIVSNETFGYRREDVQ